MAITINTLPSEYASAYRPMIYEVSSNRYDGTTNSGSPSAVADNGGFCQFTLNSHGFVVGDVLTGSAFTTDDEYNVIQTITSVVDANNFVTNVAFISNDPSGTLTRTNNNFQIKGSVYSFNGARKTITGVVDAGGGEITLTTSAAHGLSANGYVVIEGTTSYNKVVKVNSVGSATTFNVTLTYVASETGTCVAGALIVNKYASAILSGSDYIFRFNISNIAQTELTYNLEALSTALSIQTPTEESIKTFAVLFTEQYDDTDGLLQDKDTAIEDDIYKGINAALQHNESQSLTGFIAGASSREFLTAAPTTLFMTESQDYQLSFLAADGDAYKIAYQTYDNSDNPNITAYSSLVTVIGWRANAFISGLISSSVSKVDVWLVDSGNTQKTEKRTFLRDTRCYKDRVTLWFKNRYGGIDNFSFDQISGELETDKQIIDKVLPITLSADKRDVGRQVISALPDISYKIRSPYLSENEIFWLGTEIVNSVQVFRRLSNLAIPVIIKDSRQLIYSNGLSRLEFTYADANKPIVNN